MLTWVGVLVVGVDNVVGVLGVDYGIDGVYNAVDNGLNSFSVG